MHHFVGADNSCISWGHAQSGELGYGPLGQKYVHLSTKCLRFPIIPCFPRYFIFTSSISGAS